MTKRKLNLNWWKVIQYSGIFLILLGVSFAFSSMKVSMLLYFGLVTVLIGSINVLVYYIFIGTSNYKYRKYLQKRDVANIKVNT